MKHYGWTSFANAWNCHLRGLDESKRAWVSKIGVVYMKGVPEGCLRKVTICCWNYSLRLQEYESQQWIIPLMWVGEVRAGSVEAPFTLHVYEISGKVHCQLSFIIMSVTDSYLEINILKRGWGRSVTADQNHHHSNKICVRLLYIRTTFCLPQASFQVSHLWLSFDLNYLNVHSTCYNVFCFEFSRRNVDLVHTAHQ